MDRVRKPRNWWAFAFVLALVAFEIAREQAVIQANEPTTGNLFGVQASGDLVVAQGEWFRTDSGSPLERNSTVIQCNRATGSCIEASAQLSTATVRTAFESIDQYDNAQFTDTSVEYVDDGSVCAIHRVRIDLAQKRVTSTRTLKENNTPFCATLEKIVASELSDSIRHRDSGERWMDGHFLPLMRLIRRG